MVTSPKAAEKPAEEKRPRPTDLDLTGLNMDIKEDIVEDDTREIDKLSYLRDQFEIFKHDYREAFDAHGYETVANLCVNSDKKKDVVQVMRQLQKNKLKLQRYFLLFFILFSYMNF